jgi:adenine-specific DNA-methyltransferase
MPPSRVRYASYYHIWTTICLFDKPDVFGKARRRKDTSDVIATSVFEEYRRGSDGRYLIVSAIERLIREVNAKWVILSYSSGGRATAEELDEVIRRNGKLLEVLEIDYKSNVMASMRWTNEWLRDVEKPHREFLFLIEK